MASPTDKTRGGPRRSDLLKTGLIIGGSAVVGGLSGGSPAAPQAAKAGDTDTRALELLLLIEQTEVAFYSEALERGRLEGELRSYAQQVLEQERQHLGLLKKALGRDTPKPKFDFGEATSDPEAFGARAAELEDLAVAAYNGQAVNVSRATLAAAATVVSVEARHAAWIRSIRGAPPAPDATDPGRSGDAVMEGLERIGLQR